MALGPFLERLAGGDLMLHVSDAHRQVINAGTAYTYTKLSAGTGNRVSDGTETALLAPFNPVREMANPPGVITSYQSVVDWIDGFTGDTDGYTANELALWATPAGGAEYLAAYESNAMGSVFSKVAGQIFSHRLGIGISNADSVNGSFVVPAVPVATTLVAGVSRRATNAELDADEADAIANATLGPRGWWRMFTGLRIVARIEALIGNTRLDFSALKGSIMIGQVSGLIAALAAKADAVPSVVALADGATINWNFNSGLVATVTLGGNRTLAVPTNGRDNVLYLLRATQDATGSRTLTLDGSIETGDLDDPGLSTDAGAEDLLGFIKWGGNTHYLGILTGY